MTNSEKSVQRNFVLILLMKKNMVEPFPARAAIGVKQLPRDAKIEMDGVMVL